MERLTRNPEAADVLRDAGIVLLSFTLSVITIFSSVYFFSHFGILGVLLGFLLLVVETATTLAEFVAFGELVCHLPRALPFIADSRKRRVAFSLALWSAGLILAMLILQRQETSSGAFSDLMHAQAAIFVFMSIVAFGVPVVSALAEGESPLDELANMLDRN